MLLPDLHEVLGEELEEDFVDVHAVAEELLPISSRLAIAALFVHAVRSDVVRDDCGRDFAQVESGESVVEQEHDCFRCVPLTPALLRANHPAGRSRPINPVNAFDAAVADVLVARVEHDGEREARCRTLGDVRLNPLVLRAVWDGDVAQERARHCAIVHPDVAPVNVVLFDRA